MEHDRNLAGDGDDSAPTALRLHQPAPQALRLDQVIERISMAFAAA
jgi:hypothetical protein